MNGATKRPAAVYQNAMTEIVRRAEADGYDAGAVCPSNFVESIRNLSNYNPQAAGGKCITDPNGLMALISRALCTYNTFGAKGAVRVNTNALVLPDVTHGFTVGPDNASLGQFFPELWKVEALGYGIERLKVRFDVNVLLGALTVDQITEALEDLNFRIIQLGTQDRYSVVAAIGDAQDASRSVFVPAAGGFYFPKSEPFVPNMLAPEAFAFDFEGLLPGTVGVDSYEVRASIQVSWKAFHQMEIY